MVLRPRGARVREHYAPIIEIFANGSIVAEDKIPAKNGPIVAEVEWS